MPAKPVITPATNPFVAPTPTPVAPAPVEPAPVEAPPVAPVVEADPWTGLKVFAADAFQSRKPKVPKTIIDAAAALVQLGALTVEVDGWESKTVTKFTGLIRGQVAPRGMSVRQGTVEGKTAIKITLLMPPPAAAPTPEPVQGDGA